jgi:hypothetical protein
MYKVKTEKIFPVVDLAMSLYVWHSQSASIVMFNQQCGSSIGRPQAALHLRNPWLATDVLCHQRDREHPRLVTRMFSNREEESAKLSSKRE